MEKELPTPFPKIKAAQVLSTEPRNRTVKFQSRSYQADYCRRPKICLRSVSARFSKGHARPSREMPASESLSLLEVKICHRVGGFGSDCGERCRLGCGYARQGRGYARLEREGVAVGELCLPCKRMGRLRESL